MGLLAACDGSVGQRGHHPKDTSRAQGALIHWLAVVRSGREDRPMPDDQFQCDGAPTCPNAPTHVHLGSRALLQLDKYYCDRCCPLATCPNAQANRL